MTGNRTLKTIHLLCEVYKNKVEPEDYSLLGYDLQKTIVFVNNAVKTSDPKMKAVWNLYVGFALMAVDRTTGVNHL
jgi:hypothetical protein